jgi:sugar lactone lactonase YvrE
MHLSAAQLAEAPLSGALFAMATDVAGRPEPKFAG